MYDGGLNDLRSEKRTNATSTWASTKRDRRVKCNTCRAHNLMQLWSDPTRLKNLVNSSRLLKFRILKILIFLSPLVIAACPLPRPQRDLYITQIIYISLHRFNELGSKARAATMQRRAREADDDDDEELRFARRGRASFSIQ